MSDYIPEETQILIFKCLPVKSLVRFRSVCKRWKDLIDSPSFMQHHLAVQKPRMILQFNKPEFLIVDPQTLPSFDTLSLPIESNPKEYYLAGTLHGVVCLYDESSVLLWNPSIRKFSVLSPPYSNWDVTADIYQVKYSAFWMDPFSKEFKVIIFELEFAMGGNEYAYLYSSSKQDWECLPLDIDCMALPQNPAVVMGRVAYWASCKFKAGEKGMDVVLLCFDFEHDRFDIIETAPSIESPYCFEYSPLLCNWQGSLSLVYLDQKQYLDPERRCDIYTLKQGSWVHLLGINLPSYITDVKVLVRLEQVEENCKILALTSNELVVRDTRSSCIPVKREFVISDRIQVAYDFVESLLLP